MSDDFGPFNLESIASFCKLLDHELSSFQRLKIVFCVPHGQRALSIAVFLLGSHMILHSALTADETASRFRWLPLPSLSLDGPLADTKSGLTLHDYWRGLEQGRAAGWVGTASGRGGALDLERNAHYGDPLNGDVQEVVPGRLVAFCGPRDMAAGRHFSDNGGRRTLSPDYCAQVLGEMGVTAVVRLCGAEYDARAMAAAGMEHHDLPLRASASPPARVVRGFFAAADAAAGAVAVHCGAARGPAGTLLALWLMRTRGFAAREALAWVDLVRPGSAAGAAQLGYVCSMEAAMWLSAPRPPCHRLGCRHAELLAAPVPRAGRSAFVPSKARRGAGAAVPP